MAAASYKHYLLIWGLLISLQEGVNGLEKLEAQQLLNGQGPANFHYAGEKINIDDVLQYYPYCNAGCQGSRPCATQSVCVAALEYWDASILQHIQVCPVGTICCNPELCRPTYQKHCQFAWKRVNEAVETHEIPSRSASDMIASLKNFTDSRTQLFSDEILELEKLDVQCDYVCNNWDISNVLAVEKCPKSCSCEVYDVPTFESGRKDFVCEKTSSREPNSSFTYTTYATTQAISTFDKDRPTTYYTCPSDYACTKASKCSSQHSAKKEPMKKTSKHGFVTTIIAFSMFLIGLTGIAFYIVRSQRQVKTKDQTHYHKI